MCLILFAYSTDPRYPLVVLANRDETFARPTSAAAFWADAPHVFAGRDLEKNGTWLGVTRGGRLACVTNVRAPWARRDGRSRGSLVADFLTMDPTNAPSAEVYAGGVNASEFPAFNALYFDTTSLVVANELGDVSRVEEGVHGLSNARLDTSWPKVERGVAELRRWLDGLVRSEQTEQTERERLIDDAFAILGRRELAEDATLPATGVPLDVERALSSPFVHGLGHVGYGTRASTVVLVGQGAVEVIERSFGPAGIDLGEVRVRIPCA